MIRQSFLTQRDVDGNDFLSWQRNFSGNALPGGAAVSSAVPEATDTGNVPFFSTADAASDDSTDATSDPLGPVFTRGNGQKRKIAAAVPVSR